MSLYSSASQPRGERSVRFDEDSSRLEESEEEEEIDTLMRELRDSAGESSEASQALLAMQAENRDQKKQINVLGLKLKHAELSQKIAEGKLQIAMEETERVVLQRDAALQQIQRLHAQPRSSEQDPRTPSGGSFDGAARGRGDPEYISKMEGDLRHSQEAVRGFREQLEQEQRQRGEAGGKVSQLLGINGHLKEQMEGHLTRAREAEKRMLAAEAFARGAGAEAEALVRGAREEAEASARAARDKGEGLARAAKESLEVTTPLRFQIFPDVSTLYLPFVRVAVAVFVGVCVCVCAVLHSTNEHACTPPLCTNIPAVNVLAVKRAPARTHVSCESHVCCLLREVSGTKPAHFVIVKTPTCGVDAVRFQSRHCQGTALLS